MTNSPFDNIERAFDPMYLDRVAIELPRKEGNERIVMSCCVGEVIEGDVLNGDCVSTSRLDIRLMFRPCDARLVDRLQIGDIVTLADGSRYAISNIDRDLTFGIVVQARSCK